MKKLVLNLLARCLLTSMKKLALLLMICLMILGARNTSMEEIKTKFNEPGDAFRGKPFWSWNGELEEDELDGTITMAAYHKFLQGQPLEEKDISMDHPLHTPEGYPPEDLRLPQNRRRD